MDSSLKFERKDGFLQITLKGSYDRGSYLTFTDQISRRCEELRIEKLLIDGSTVTETNIPILDRFLLGERVAKTLLGIKIAIVWPPDDIMGFGSKVANNRGASIKVTGNLNDAIGWLLDENVS